MSSTLFNNIWQKTTQEIQDRQREREEKAKVRLCRGKSNVIEDYINSLQPDLIPSLCALRDNSNNEITFGIMPGQIFGAFPEQLSGFVASDTQVIVTNITDPSSNIGDWRDSGDLCIGVSPSGIFLGSQRGGFKAFNGVESVVEVLIKAAMDSKQLPMHPGHRTPDAVSDGLKV